MADVSSVLGLAGAISSPLLTYSPSDIQIILHTVDAGDAHDHLVHGYAAGTFLQIERDTTPFETGEVTMDGRTQRKLGILDGMYTVVVTLTQSTLSNSQLEQMYYRDVALTYGYNDYARQEITIVDKKADKIILGPSRAWIESIPTVTYSEGVETRQWTLKVFARQNEVSVTGNAAEFEFNGTLGIGLDLAKGAYGKFRG